MDPKGNNHKAAGRPDGGRFDRKMKTCPAL